jgi:hypothetical protein
MLRQGTNITYTTHQQFKCKIKKKKLCHINVIFGYKQKQIKKQTTHSDI